MKGSRQIKTRVGDERRLLVTMKAFELQPSSCLAPLLCGIALALFREGRRSSKNQQSQRLPVELLDCY